MIEDLAALSGGHYNKSDNEGVNGDSSCVIPHYHTVQNSRGGFFLFFVAAAVSRKRAGVVKSSRISAYY